MSTGLVTMTKTALGACSTSGGRIIRVSLMVASARSRRVCPGFCFAPAVTTTTSASAHTAMSSEPTTSAIGMNWIPCPRSAASAATLALSMSYSATVRAAPRMRAAYATVAPTAPAPTTATLVVRRSGSGPLPRPFSSLS